MLLSVSCTYGIQAVLYLAAAAPDGYTPVRAIGRDLGISASFLSKVLQRLKAAGIITARRGPNGGVALARDTERLTLKELVLAVDGDALFTACVLGLPTDGERCAPCPLHREWRAVQDGLESMFDEFDVASTAGCVACALVGTDGTTDDGR